MSLNGLDSDTIVQAHQNTFTEPGAWFLLKYVNRDTVDLLGRGNGGVSEARNLLEAYDEKSPLCGMVQYRRRRFIVKYVPVGTSRLLQVRLTVQFQSILDHFTPYDTIFSFVAAHELSDSALSLSTILHSSTAPRSKSSSSSSLSQPRLDEITEDFEGPQPAPAATTVESVPTLGTMPVVADEDLDQMPSASIRARALLARRKQEREQEAAHANHNLSISSFGTAQLLQPQTPDPDSDPANANAISLATDKDLPAPPVESQDSPPKRSIAAPSPAPDFPFPQIDSDSDDDVRRPVPRQTTQVRHSVHLSVAESSSISKWSDEVLASTATSKQKRTVRGHGDPEVRPKTSGNTEEVGISRRANLPTTVRVSTRSSGQSSRPGSQQSTRSVPARFLPSSDFTLPLPFSTVASRPGRVHSPIRQTTSPASLFIHPTPTVTPEKMRLMRALQQRKRNQLLTQRSNTAPPASYHPLESMDSTQSVLSDLSPVNFVPTPAQTTSRELPTEEPEQMDKHESSTTCPTSVVTTSDNHSTKPSSFANDSPKNASRTSLSSGTTPSTTPKAENDKIRHQVAEHKDIPPPVQPAAIDLLSIPIPEIPTQPTEDSATLNRPLTYHCATADFLADIEEEDRGRPVSAVAAKGASSTPVTMAKRSKKPYPFEASTTVLAQGGNTSDGSDDESLMEELQNATVHEAKPMSVNRTPATPVLSTSSTRASTFELSSEPASAGSDRSMLKRPIKNPSRPVSIDSQVSTPDRCRAVSRAGSTRSLSTALPQWPPQPAEPIPALPKQRPIIGITISKRVKTFEGLSHRDSVVLSPSQKSPLPRSSSLSTMLKRASFLSYSPGDDNSESPNSRPTPSPLRSDFDDIEPDTSSPRPRPQRPSTSTEVYTAPHKTETLSVTARIVRDPVKPSSAHGTSDTTGSMHASPLIVAHETASIPDLRPPFLRDYSAKSMDSLATSPITSERRRFSFSSHKSGGQKLSPVESKSNRLSFVGQIRMSKAASESSSSLDDKKQSRTSRMLKRLSGLGKTRFQRDSLAASPTREPLQSPTYIIEEAADTDTDVGAGTENESGAGVTRHVVDIGEVNVQFVETLLWKRRFLRVDDQGYLIFAPPTNDLSNRGMSRKIHLEELHKPTLPDHERQEMAWSILLDLKSGGTVQCACESKRAQGLVLRMLIDAHNAYHQLYG